MLFNWIAIIWTKSSIAYTMIAWFGYKVTSLKTGIQPRHHVNRIQFGLGANFTVLYSTNQFTFFKSNDVVQNSCASALTRSIHLGLPMYQSCLASRSRHSLLKAEVDKIISDIKSKFLGIIWKHFIWVDLYERTCTIWLLGDEYTTE